MTIRSPSTRWTRAKCLDNSDRRSGGAAVTIKAQELFSDGEYYFDCQDSENAPMLSGGVLTLSARRTDSAGQAAVTLKIDLRSGTLLP